MCNGLGSGGRGTAVGVLADSLLKTSTLVKWREGLIAGSFGVDFAVLPRGTFHRRQCDGAE